MITPLQYKQMRLAIRDCDQDLTEDMIITRGIDLALSEMKDNSKQFITRNEIIKAVARGYRVPADALFERNRTRDVVRARNAAIRAIYMLKPEVSTTQIGSDLNKNHATILYSLDRLTKRRPSV